VTVPRHDQAGHHPPQHVSLLITGDAGQKVGRVVALLRGLPRAQRQDDPQHVSNSCGG
jgi:hypothetical protein